MEAIYRLHGIKREMVNKNTCVIEQAARVSASMVSNYVIGRSVLFEQREARSYVPYKTRHGFK